MLLSVTISTIEDAVVPSVQQEMALLSQRMEPVGNESLGKWEQVGSGGFGHVYKARHKDLGFDVAIKILHDGDCPFMPMDRALCEEASKMKKASCEFVLMLYGIYRGCPPIGGASMQQGIVMQFMERGSVQSLLNGLSGPPPWPLAFRLAHQVALGMNFLHSNKLVHNDLKPSNVLLNDDLNAKIADFGLCRVSTSAMNSNNRETSEVIGGSYKYMPPEAFEASYEPVRAFDRYSYGILLWSIVTGKEPYPRADFSLVALKIPLGDRPPCDFDHTKAEGLKELVDLMKKCWDNDPSERPNFKACLTVTENVFSKHKKGIYGAVLQVLTQLDSNTSVTPIFPLQTPEQSNHDTVDRGRFTKTEMPSIQNFVKSSSEEMSNTDKAKFVDDNRATLIQDVHVVMAIVEELGDMVHGETYSVIEAEKPSQEKMRVLYKGILRPGGVKVKAAFYDALKKHHPALVERLDG